MLNVEINGQSFDLKQSPSEFTIGEYEKMVSILRNPEYDSLDQYYNLFNYLGVPTELLDEFDIFNFKTLITEYNKMEENKEEEFVKEFEIDGVKYTSYANTTEFKMNVKQMKLAIKFAKEDDTYCMAEVLSVLFKEEGVDNYDEKVIRNRAKVFRNKLTADISNPYFLFFIKKMIKNA